MVNTVQRFLSFAFASADVLLEIGDDGLIVFSMGACRALLGIEDNRLIGQSFFGLFATNDRATVEVMTKGLWGGARCGPLIVPLQPRRPDDPPRHVVLHACRLPNQQGSFSCTLSQATTAAVEAAKGGRHDRESGLLDGASFATAASEAVRMAKDLGEKVEMTFIDIPELSDLSRSDPGRGFNLAKRVGELLRGSAVGGEMAGRLAETRFGVLHKTGEGNFDQTLEDIRTEGRKLGAKLTVGRSELELGAEGLSPEDTVRAVRFAVNQFATIPHGESLPSTLQTVFDSMVETTIERMSSFVKVVRNNDFALTYQPVVEIASGQLHHFEVLARFEDNKSPFETIVFAEEIDLIERFDLAVCGRAISVLNAGLASIPGLAVNLSGRSLASPAFLQVLMQMAEENRHLGGRLSFEVTESANLEDLTKANSVIRALRKLGYAVYLDDFGAGAAAFRYLQALEVDGLKIDGDYVRRLADSVRDHTILVGIVRLARSLALESVAERVEDRDTAVALYEMGVMYGQGWFYGKPLSEPVWRPSGPMGVAASSSAKPEPTARSAQSSSGRRRGAVTTWG